MTVRNDKTRLFIKIPPHGIESSSPDVIREAFELFFSKMVGLGCVYAASLVTVMLYDPKIAQEFARRMLDKGVYVVGFCYPVVPKGKDRIRTQVSAGHTKEDLDFAVKCFKEVKEEMGI